MTIDLTNKAHEGRETIEDLIGRIETTLELCDEPFFITGYCASDKESFEAFLLSLQKKLPLSSPSRTFFQFDETHGYGALITALEKAQYTKGERIQLWGVEGLETFQKLSAHGYDQGIVESLMINLKRDLPKSPKKIVVVSNIGKSRGERIYQLFKEEARRGSQFKAFYWEL